MIPLTIEEVLCHFSAQTNAPSSMGSQLERLALQSEARKHGSGWTTHAKPSIPTPKDPDGAILKDADLYRFVTDLERMRSVDADAPTLIRLYAGHQVPAIGCTLVRTLRAFQAALAAPSDEDRDRASRRADKATPARRDEVFQRAIAEYRAPRGLDAVVRLWGLESTAIAAELVADCLLVTGLYLALFNRRKGAAA